MWQERCFFRLRPNFHDVLYGLLQGGGPDAGDVFLLHWLPPFYFFSSPLVSSFFAAPLVEKTVLAYWIFAEIGISSVLYHLSRSFFFELDSFSEVQLKLKINSLSLPPPPLPDQRIPPQMRFCCLSRGK